MPGQLRDVPRTSFRLPFGIGFDDPLRADAYDSENVVFGRTDAADAPSAVFLGKLAEFEQMRRNVWLDCHGAHAIYVIGKRRSGKSYTLGTICEGLVSKSWLRLGFPDQAVLLLDTLNIYGALHVPIGNATGGRELWHVPTEALPVQYVAPERTRSTIVGESIALTVDPAWLTLEDWCGLFDVDPFSDPLGHLLAVILDAVQSTWQLRGASGHNDQVHSGVDDCLRCLDTNQDALQFGDSTREALRRRLLAIERLNFLARPSPHLHDLLTAGRVTVLQLRDLDDRVRALVVAVIVRELMRARARTDASARAAAIQAHLSGNHVDAWTVRDALPRCWIIIDEAHNYLPSGGTLPSRPVLRRLITEGRNVGLSVVVATQQPSGLDSSIQRNADALLIHSMSMRDDIAAADGMLNTLVPDVASWGTAENASGKVFEKLVRALPQGYCLVSTDTANRIFAMKVRPRLSMHGGDSY